ncbi:hypothetical protein PR001_g25390 [Phytophthora rubi]|uniref:Uncharacterized protein n=1 Tax=Phytophthora rubi TaxID=129364 RepID=A0A6A3J025_9STRA|nr:hypothetical protein PR001_g25390 [Phytophthora rubi]KAE8987691.1 hypothetical protein PR002_g21980 [Phytophthora rubi]
MHIRKPGRGTGRSTAGSRQVTSGVSGSGSSESIDHTEQSRQDQQGATPQGDDDTDMLSDADSNITGYVGSSAPSSTQSPAPTPGSEFPFCLDSNFAADAPMMGPDMPETKTGLTASEDGGKARPVSDPAALHDPLNQDGFSIEKISLAPGMPQQFPLFLLPFRGSLTSVPANGQCAYAALYASTTATVETKLTFTSEVVPISLNAAFTR